jgi:ectonucleotide pyrophosphatase/phosphodiesterase family protein 5
MTNADWWPYPAIWSVNEQRKGARSGVSSWPQESIRISKYQPYNRSRSFRDNIDEILLWFNDPVEPINFGAIYSDEPDRTGHRTGPYSVNTTEMVHKCDEHLGYLLDRIDSNKNLRENLHLIIVSDHGIEQINGVEHPLYIENYIDEAKVKVYGTSPAMNIFVQSGKDGLFIEINDYCLFSLANDIEIVRKNLSKIPHSQVYRREDIPDRYHYKNHPRIGDLFLLFEPGYEIIRKPTRMFEYKFRSVSFFLTKIDKQRVVKYVTTVQYMVIMVMIIKLTP